ncbi:unnamed protein product, partial [Prorocentrum cordatum]
APVQPQPSRLEHAKRHALGLADRLLRPDAGRPGRPRRRKPRRKRKHGSCAAADRLAGGGSPVLLEDSSDEGPQVLLGDSDSEVEAPTQTTLTW